MLKCNDELTSLAYLSVDSHGPLHVPLHQATRPGVEPEGPNDATVIIIAVGDSDGEPDPAQETTAKDAPTASAIRVLKQGLALFGKFLGAVLFVPLVVLHILIDIVHRLLAILGDCCIVSSRKDLCRCGKKDDDDCDCNEVCNNWGFLCATISVFLWGLSKLSLSGAAIINTHVFQFEPLRIYANCYAGKTLPKCGEVDMSFDDAKFNVESSKVTRKMKKEANKAQRDSGNPPIDWELKKREHWWYREIFASQFRFYQPRVDTEKNPAPIYPFVEPDTVEESPTNLSKDKEEEEEEEEDANPSCKQSPSPK
jgi:hypothetical protein